jgi:sugar-specific transcriptional regulator TrmB
VYFCLERLAKLGLVEMSVKRGRKAYTAVEPGELLKLVHTKKLEIEAKEKSLLRAIPKLESLARHGTVSTDVRVYEGVPSLWKLARELLHDRKDFFFLYSGAAVLQFITLAQLLKKFTKKRRQIRGTKVYAISDRNPIAEKRFREGDTDFRELRFLSKPIMFESIFCLCGNKIVLISLKGTPKAVVIENEPMANIMKFLFWSLWESLPQ